MTKHVSLLESFDGPLLPLASFRLENDRVVAVFHDPRYERELEANGIAAMVGSELKLLRPSDGKAFYDSLEAAYARSSLMRVSVTADEQS